MTNSNNSVDVQGMGNTNNLEMVMNLYTKGFMKVLGNYNIPLQESIKIVDEVKPSTKRKPKSKQMNKGFEKLKNTLLRDRLQNCKEVSSNPNIYMTVKELGYKSIYVLDKRSIKKWKEYFLKGKVYINKDIKSSSISQRILFDRSIGKQLGKNNITK